MTSSVPVSELPIAIVREIGFYVKERIMFGVFQHCLDEFSISENFHSMHMNFDDAAVALLELESENLNSFGMMRRPPCSSMAHNTPNFVRIALQSDEGQVSYQFKIGLQGNMLQVLNDHHNHIIQACRENTCWLTFAHNMQELDIDLVDSYTQLKTMLSAPVESRVQSPSEKLLDIMCEKFNKNTAMQEFRHLVRCRLNLEPVPLVA